MALSMERKPSRNTSTQIFRWVLAPLLAVLFCIVAGPETAAQQIVVTGTLSRSMAMGAESTGWSINAEPAITIDGKRRDSILVSDARPGRLESFDGKQVRLVGRLSHRQGVETGTQPVLRVVSLRQNAKAHTESGQAIPFDLTGSDWLLHEMDGHAVLDGMEATLSFSEAGKVSGSGSCNRFFGPVKVTGDHISIGPLGSTRMACPPEVMDQESSYLAALQTAEHFAWQDPYLLIYAKGIGEPLRFTRLPVKQ